MNDNPLRKQVFESLNLKETDELLQIWQDNKRNEWSDLAFEVIEQILQERGEEIPAQDQPQPESEEEDNEGEETDLEGQATTGRLPSFYKPQQVLFFINATSIAAWVTLAIYVITGLWYAFSNPKIFTEANTMTIFAVVVSFLARIVTGVISFFFLKGASYSMSVLMEFEFNSRNAK